MKWTTWSNNQPPDNHHLLITARAHAAIIIISFIAMQQQLVDRPALFWMRIWPAFINLLQVRSNKKMTITSNLHPMVDAASRPTRERQLDWRYCAQHPPHSSSETDSFRKRKRRYSHKSCMYIKALILIVLNRFSVHGGACSFLWLLQPLSMPPSAS